MSEANIREEAIPGGAATPEPPRAPGLDESQQELYQEGGETDSRSQDLADKYEGDGSATDDQSGQRVSGGQYGSDTSDANGTNRGPAAG